MKNLEKLWNFKSAIFELYLSGPEFVCIGCRIVLLIPAAFEFIMREIPTKNIEYSM